MRKVLVFATHNNHKAREIQQVVGDRYEIKTLTDIGCHDEIEETGLTLEENAGIKSNYVFQKYGLNCFADDTGLEVESLDGAPGVFSARFAGIHKNDQDNMKLLLARLEQHTNRRARFRTVISCRMAGAETLFEGCLEGEIIPAPRGANGFGYDPIFKPFDTDQTLAEMSAVAKNEISHRSKATHQLLQFLKKES